jgi:uncharacterized Tic20 family protein
MTDAIFTEPDGALFSKEERTWATIAHLSAFAMYFSGVGHIVGPLVVWLIKRDTLPFVDDQAKEALNFQISWTIYLIANFVLFFTIIGAVVAIPLFYILPIFHVVCMIVAAFKANEGMRYRYPLTFRFLK